MLTCREINERMGDLVDGELGLGERMKIRLHLFMCNKCRRFARNFNLLVRSLALQSHVPPPATPPEFVDKTMQNLDADGSLVDSSGPSTD